MGSKEDARQPPRERRGAPLLEAIARDLRTAMRSLRGTPAFALAVVLILGLAIGANTVVVSAVDAVLLRPLPVSHLDRIVSIGHRNPVLDSRGGMQAAEVFALEERHDLFDAVGGCMRESLNLTGLGEPQHVAGAATTSGFFSVFGVEPFLGRLYDSGDEGRGATSVVVLSYGLWRDLTGADVHAIGRTIQLNDSSYTILGVLPPKFAYPIGVQLWTPKTLDIFLNRRATDVFLYAGAVVPTVARLHVGMTLPRLESELTAAMRDWATQKPQYYTMRPTRPIYIRSFISAWSGQLRSILILLIGAVALVLIIASANVGSLLLLRTTGRAREIAVRMALGGTRAAVVRQFAVETGLLAVTGGLIGVGIAEALLAAVGRTLAAHIPELGAIRPDPFVFAVSAVVTIAAAIACGIVPAIRAAAADPRDALGATGGRGHSPGVGRSRFLRSAVVVQIALALALSLAGAVAARSVAHLLAVDPGFDPSHVVAARLLLPSSRYSDTTLGGAVRSLAFHDRLFQLLRAAPGIEAASTVNVAPFGFDGPVDAAIHRMMIARQIGPDMRNALAAYAWDVDADYFRTMGIPVRAGTGFTGHEQQDQVRAYPTQLQVNVVIDDALARRLFPGEDPVGKVIGPWAPGLRVVGVVGSVKQSDLSSPEANDGAVYFPVAPTQNQQTIVVRTRLSTAAVAAALRHVVREIDPDLALFDVEPLGDMVSRSAGPREIASWLLAGFAALSLVLALLGIYGVLSYTTSQRAKEMGIRLALGAAPSEVFTNVVRGAFVLTCTGVLAGTAAYVLLERGLSAVTFGVDPSDPAMIAFAGGALATFALAAALPAAIRAARTDPAVSLRAD